MNCPELDELREYQETYNRMLERENEMLRYYTYSGDSPTDLVRRTDCNCDKCRELWNRRG